MQDVFWDHLNMISHPFWQFSTPPPPILTPFMTFYKVILTLFENFRNPAWDHVENLPLLFGCYFKYLLFSKEQFVSVLTVQCPSVYSSVILPSAFQRVLFVCHCISLTSTFFLYPSLSVSFCLLSSPVCLSHCLSTSACSSIRPSFLFWLFVYPHFFPSVRSLPSVTVLLSP